MWSHYVSVCTAGSAGMPSRSVMTGGQVRWLTHFNSSAALLFVSTYSTKHLYLYLHHNHTHHIHLYLLLLSSIHLIFLPYPHLISLSASPSSPPTPLTSPPPLPPTLPGSLSPPPSGRSDLTPCPRHGVWHPSRPRKPVNSLAAEPRPALSRSCDDWAAVSQPQPSQPPSPPPPPRRPAPAPAPRKQACPRRCGPD